MTVFTKGGRNYARAVCAIMDKDEAHFASRIISRDDLPGCEKRQMHDPKELSLICPTDPSMIVILDDR